MGVLPGSIRASPDGDMAWTLLPRFPSDAYDDAGGPGSPSSHRIRGHGIGPRMGRRFRVKNSPVGWSARSTDAPNASQAPSVPIHKELNP